MIRPAIFRVFMLASVCAFLTASAVQAQTQDDMASPSQFTDVTQAAGIDFHLTCGSAEKRHVMGSLCGGAAFFDYDNDGWKDIFVANGHVYPQMDGSALGTTYAQRDLLFRNRGGGRFEEMGGSALSASISMTGGVSRGAASADFDNDGDIDLLVTRLDGPPVLLRNNLIADELREDEGAANWIRIRLRGTVSNRDGLGARVRIVAGEIAQTAEARCSSSYLTSNDPRLHFGLGGAKRVKRIEVRWPSGAVDRIEDVEANQELTIEEGKGGAPR